MLHLLVLQHLLRGDELRVLLRLLLPLEQLLVLQLLLLLHLLPLQLLPLNLQLLLLLLRLLRLLRLLQRELVGRRLAALRLARSLRGCLGGGGLPLLLLDRLSWRRVRRSRRALLAGLR